MSVFQNKTLMITGGTGSFGNIFSTKTLARSVSSAVMKRSRTTCVMNCK